MQPPDNQNVRALSAREREVATLVAAGKSNRVISENLFLSERTVEHHVSSILNKLNVHSRIELVAGMLQASSQGVQPSRLPVRPKFLQRNVFAQLRARIRRAPWFLKSPPAPAGRFRAVIPRPPTVTLGRDDEIARVVSEALACRLVTVTGPGGVGKTRVAIEAAFMLQTRHDVACIFVDFVAASTYDDVITAVAKACNVADRSGSDALGAVVAALDQHELLLVFDTCDHVSSSVAAIARSLLAATPSIRVLTASRRPIGLPGERLVRIAPLKAPAAATSRELMLASPAVQLFVARARDCSGFELDDASIVPTVDLCNALDGLPLAIEIAASKTSALSVTEIRDHVRESLKLLTFGTAATQRQQSLSASIDWSFQLLQPRQREMFRTLSTFRAAWTVDEAIAASAVHDAEPISVLEDLIALADHSLIVRIDENGGAGFRMLNTTRLFALGPGAVA
jgi:predicted ATPase/DNA-binding CsgD family transcriptional regulator